MSRQIIDAAVIRGRLKEMGIKLPKPPCCGRKSPAVSYSEYLKRMNMHGEFLIRDRGIIVEMCSL